MREEREASWESLEELRPFLETWIGRRCRDGNDVDDVVQETLLRAARYRGSLADTDKLRAWSTRIAANVLTDCLRRDGRVRRTVGDEWALDELEAEGGADDGVERDEPPLLRVAGRGVDFDEALAHLGAVLGDLRPADRAVLLSYYQGGQSCRETARQCGIPLELVKVRLFRARERVRRALRRALSLGPSGEPRRIGA